MMQDEMKILAGAGGLIRLIDRAAATYLVTLDADNRTVTWGRNSTLNYGSIQGSDMQSVKQEGAVFVVQLQPSTNGVSALTFSTSSKEKATEWVRAVEALIEQSEEQPPSAAAHQPSDANASVATPVSLKYAVKGTIVEKQYALLVIACEPRNLIGICDYSEEELQIFEKLVSYTFHTTLVKVRVPENKPNHGVIFAPGPLGKMEGDFYGFRNESAKHFGLKIANEMEENIVTIYQLLGPTSTPWTPADFQEVLERQLRTSSWWPYGDQYEILKSVTTPYFDHFDMADLRGGLPWKLLDLQGQNSTIFVHGFTCFESVLHCWSYANLMLEPRFGAKSALPENLDAPIVILGAGVSGLLFASRLKALGYTNIDILEKTDRYGGKTHTVVEDGPYPKNSETKEKTVCELGTCYLSPAYKPMVDALANYLVGNHQIDFTKKDPNFRGIVTKDELPPSFNADLVMDYGEYVILKAEAELGYLHDELIDRLVAKIDLAIDLAKYSLLHLEYMGLHMPMPATPPSALQREFGKQNFLEFLEYHNLLALVGVLQYGYEVQGYGVLRQIPAYYGLVWITPAITWTILMDSLYLEDTPIVTAWTLGWGNLWKQIVEKNGLNITLNAETVRITRAG
jgi:hypothetical protein